MVDELSLGDEIITHTVYGHRKFRKYSIIMPFKRYRSNSTSIRHHGRSNQGESRNQTREMRDRQRDQPPADSRVMMDRQIHQPDADPLLPRPANTNVDPFIPRAATTSNVDLYPSIKGQGHQELFQDPANHQPSLAHLSTSAGPKRYTLYLLQIIYQLMNPQLPIHPTRTLLGTILYALQHSVMIMVIINCRITQLHHLHGA